MQTYSFVVKIKEVNSTDLLMRRGMNMFIVLGIISVVIIGLLWTQMFNNRRNQEKFEPTGQLHVVGNRRLHIHVKGNHQDGLTVLFDHNSEYGASSLSWHLVIERVQHFARVASIDRAGYGWSEGGPYPRTNIESVEDMKELLLAANIKGPVIYVGHGYGAINARIFASRYPKQVIGLVLIDPWHENEYAGKFPQTHLDELEMKLKMYKRHMLFSPWGLVKPLLSFNNSMKMQAVYYAKELSQKFWAISGLNKTIKTIYSESAFAQAGFQQLSHVTTYKSIPLTVVMSGKLEQHTTKQAKYEAASELKNLSTEGLIIIAPNSRSHPPLEQPELVADAIRRMITHVKKEYV